MRKSNCHWILPENRVRNLSNPFVNVFIIAANTLLRSVGFISSLGQTVSEEELLEMLQFCTPLS